MRSSEEVQKTASVLAGSWATDRGKELSPSTFVHDPLKPVITGTFTHTIRRSRHQHHRNRRRPGTAAFVRRLSG